MKKEENEEISNRIMVNIRAILEVIPENPIYESHFAKAIESYLRSLEILERMRTYERQDGDL